MYLFSMVINQGRSALAKALPLVSEKESLPSLIHQRMAALADKPTYLGTRSDALSNRILQFSS
ncbi:hypothetical protein MN202_02750 [Rheinheimera muenzenbergensis]|uniref:Uncharacterized protein n=1 Tax=Rheinheimera muenzenbergensis TaxID=1193628 RepID=A0ABU8C2N9_9GAMM